MNNFNSKQDRQIRDDDGMRRTEEELRWRTEEEGERKTDHPFPIIFPAADGINYKERE